MITTVSKKRSTEAKSNTNDFANLCYFEKKHYSEVFENEQGNAKNYLIVERNWSA